MKSIIKILFIVIIFLHILLISSCKEWPHDPNHTLENIKKNKIIRVGLIDNPPWSSRINNQATGIDIAIIKNFAQYLNVTPKWFFLNEEKAMFGLMNDQLDIVIGGISKDTLWQNKVGLTRPYYHEIFYIGFPPGLSKHTALKNLPIAVQPMSFLIQYIKYHNAIPFITNDLFRSEHAVAAGKTELIAHQYYLKKKLSDRDYVFAIENGENLFLTTLESYLKQNQKSIHARIKSKLK